MADQDLTTLEAVKAYLGVTVTADDAELTRLVTMASTVIAEYCARTLVETEHDEYYDGNSNSILPLLNTPITEVSSVTMDGSSLTASSNNGYGYLFDKLMIWLVGGAFTKGLRNIRVVYTAGYAADAIPESLQQAAIELVADRYRYRQRVGKKSENIAQGGGTTYDTMHLSDRIKGLVNPYVRKAVI
jgi:uncharacterized phiE125 gp8 family phage protein